jgi:hypothetical protein
MSQLIQEGLNWVIIDFVEDLHFYDELAQQVDTTNFNMYTSAKGIGSVQNYIIPPRWLPGSTITEPKLWPKLKVYLENMVQRQLIHHGKMPDNWKKIHAYSAWMVTGEKGSYHTLHDHGPNNISSVLYLNVPDKPNDPEGQIYFVFHSDSYSSLSIPRTRTMHFVPGRGSLVIFPSWIPHGVYPQGDGLRRTLNVDFNGNPDFYYDDPAAGQLTYNGQAKVV